jgi:predicted PurR-regulated permease PerM
MGPGPQIWRGRFRDGVPRAQPQEDRAVSEPAKRGAPPSAGAPPPRAEPRGPDLTRTVLAVLLIALLIAAPFWILKPFLGAIVWATMLAVATWPLMIRLQKGLWGKRWLSITVMTLGLLALVAVPLAAVVIGLLENTDRIKAFLSTAPRYHIPAAPAWLGKLPLVGGKAAAMWTSAAAAGVPALVAQVAPHVRGLAGWLAAKVGGFGAFLLEFVLTVAIQAVMFARGEQAAAGVKAFARRIAGEYGEQTVDLVGGTIRTVAMGVVVTALVQAAFAGLGLAIAQVPVAALLTLAMFALCVSQIGPIPVLAPVVIWAFTSKGVGWGTFLILWSVATGLINNVLRPVLLKKGVDLPVLVTLTGVIGGLAAFGTIGVFGGPVLLAVSYTLLKAWVREGPTNRTAGSLPE